MTDQETQETETEGKRKKKIAATTVDGFLTEAPKDKSASKLMYLGAKVSREVSDELCTTLTINPPTTNGARIFRALIDRAGLNEFLPPRKEKEDVDAESVWIGLSLERPVANKLQQEGLSVDAGVSGPDTLRALIRKALS